MDPNVIERVYKYPIPVTGEWVSVMMPVGAKVLSAQVQNGVLNLWARVTVDRPPITHRFRIAGTGHDLGDFVGRHIGTVQLGGGSLVLHVFEEGDAP